MSSTQFRIKRLMFFARLSARFAIGFCRRLHNLLQRERLAFDLAISPARLNRRTKSGAFNHLESDYWETENVGNDLAHAGTLGAAADSEQFFGLDPKTNKSVHSLGKSDRDSLN